MTTQQESVDRPVVSRRGDRGARGKESHASLAVLVDRRFSVSIAVVVAVLLAQSAVAAESITYRVLQESPSFMYVSGDLPCDVEAFLRGHVSIFTNADSQEAILDLSNLTLHFAQTLVFGMPFEYPEGHYCSEFAQSLEDSTLSSVVPGLNTPLLGNHVTTTKFVFGPSHTDDQAFVLQFTLDEFNLGLNGSAIFNGDDGPSYFIDARLMVVPEPGAYTLATMPVVAIIVFCRFRRVALKR
jgi:hypothetical protein